MRFTPRQLTAVAMTIGATLAVAGAASAAPSFVVVADTRIGTFAVKADGSLAGVIRAYGQPMLRRTGEACTATWALYGLTMSFYNLGGANPCTPRFGRFSRAVMYGTRWRTDRGLRIGMSSKSNPQVLPSRGLPPWPALLLAVGLVARHAR